MSLEDGVEPAEMEEVSFKSDIDKFVTVEETDMAIRLNNPMEIEEALSGIIKLDKKVKWLADLKKYRAQQIDEKIRLYENKVDYLRSIIQTCMDEHKEKTLDFPGVAKVTVKTNPVKWEVLSEIKLFEFLKKKEKYDQIVEEQPKILFKDLTKFLNSLSDDEVKELKEAVEKIEGNRNLSITKYNKPVEEKKVPIVAQGQVGF
jgi:predicted HAD superfamily phosphohydrolase